MRLNYRLLTTLFAMIILQATFATAPKKVEQCPSTEAIRSVGVNCIVFNSNENWAASNVHNTYDTSVEWTFIVGNTGDRADNENDARQKVMHELQSVTRTQGPIYNELGDTICFYKTNKINHIMAITPILKGKPSHC